MSNENGNATKQIVKTVQVPADLYEIISEMAENTKLPMRVVTEILLRKVLTPERHEDTPETRVERELEAWKVR